MLVRITNDVFDIARRVKELDEGYYPVYDTEKHRYEIRHSDGDYIAVVVPYDGLDARILRHLYLTRRDNALAALEKMEAENERQTKLSVANAMDEAGYKARQILSYLDDGKRHELPEYSQI